LRGLGRSLRFRAIKTGDDKRGRIRGLAAGLTGIGLVALLLSAPSWLPGQARAETVPLTGQVAPDTAGSPVTVLPRRAALPLLARSWASEDEQVSPAIARANYYRSIAGVDPVSSHPAIESAAQSHADYYLLNYGDSEAETYGPHGEVAGKPGYTGRWPSDRLVAAGYPWLGGAEVMHFINDPVASIDGWVSGIYHRVLILDPSARYAGYGAGRAGRAAVDVLDLGSGPRSPEAPSVTPYPLVYPADGQTAVPALWSGAEAPDPLPPGASRPVGYPFTLQGVGGPLRVDGFELTDAAGQPVAVHPSPAECAMFNCYAAVPVAPMTPGAEYTVSAWGTVSDTPFDRTWRFTTAP